MNYIFWCFNIYGFYFYLNISSIPFLLDQNCGATYVYLSYIKVQIRMNICFGWTATIWSQTQKIRAFSFLATEIVYLALFYLPSSVSGSIMISQLTDLGSILARMCIKNLPSLRLLSLMSLMAAISPLPSRFYPAAIPLAQSTISFSVLSPINLP